MSHLQFQWNHRKAASSGKTSRVPKDVTVLVRIPKDLHALGVRIRQPQRSRSHNFCFQVPPLTWVVVELGASPKLLVVLSTGRNHISKASIKLSAPSGINFKYSEAVLNGQGISLRVPDMRKRSKMTSQEEQNWYLPVTVYLWKK